MLVAGDFDQVVEAQLRERLPREVLLWRNAQGQSDRPPLVLLGEKTGLVGMKAFSWAAGDVASASGSCVILGDGRKEDPVGELGRSLERLRQLAGGVGRDLRIRGFVILPRFAAADLVNTSICKCVPREMVLCGDELTGDGLLGKLANGAGVVSAELVNSVRDRLYPETSFEVAKVASVEGRWERLQKRVRLDGVQESCARSILGGATIVSGVPGSGKSLVLAARARLLGEMHPDWNIQVLCFNHSLVDYLSNLVSGAGGQISVSTFHSWVRQHRLWLPWVGDEEKAAREGEIIRNAIKRGVAQDSVDAVLVDEGQDFRPVWIDFVIHALRKDRGGMLFAADTTQSIYQVAKIDGLFDGDVRWLTLTSNYRNTAEIGTFAYRSVFNVGEGDKEASDCNPYHPRLPEFQLNGEPVQIVWAESWNAQAEFIAREVKKLVGTKRVSYGDVAVLFPKRSGTKRLAEAMEKEQVPHYVLTRGVDGRSGFDLADDSVKVMTAHAAKGLEFPVVFLFGAEATKVPEDLEEALEEDANRARVLFVAMTRATDLLYVTYTRPNLLIERAEHLDCCVIHRYPGDFEF